MVKLLEKEGLVLSAPAYQSGFFRPVDIGLSETGGQQEPSTIPTSPASL